jgi:hypothetical protein
MEEVNNFLDVYSGISTLIQRVLYFFKTGFSAVFQAFQYGIISKVARKKPTTVLTATKASFVQIRSGNGNDGRREESNGREDHFELIY